MISNGEAKACGVWPGNASPEVAASDVAAWSPFHGREPSSPQFTKFSVSFRRSFVRGWPWLALLVGVGYYLGAKIGFALTFKPHPVSVLWPPNSILMAALLLTPKRVWWILLLAVLPAHWLVQLQSNVPASMVLCWYISNSLEALMGASFVRYFLPRPIRLDRLYNVSIFCLFGIFLAPFLSSFLDAGFVILNHWGSGTYWQLWRIRFTSNVLAVLTITPFLVTWISGGVDSFRNVFRERRLEAIILGFALLLTSLALFNVTTDYDAALLYAPLPLLLWAVVRFGQYGATASIALLSFVAIWGAAHRHGPFIEGSPEESALYVQMFLIFMAFPLKYLAAVIEERKTVENTLRERDERVGLAAETANLALWTVDFEQSESWMSDKGRELFAFRPDEPFSREAFLTRVHPEDREKVNEAIEQARSDSLAFKIAYRLMRPDGEVRSLIANGRYLRNDRGEISELIGVAADVTSQIDADREMRRQRDEVVRLNRLATVGELTASIAHELNQPLSAIVSNASAGQRFIDKGNVDPETLRDILIDVAADGRRAHDVIQNIRNTVKQGAASRELIDLNDVVKQVTHLIQPSAAFYSCEMETSLDTDLPRVEADPIQIQQVLINLVTNAFEAMTETPVARRKVKICTSLNGSETVHVCVCDRGSGIQGNGNQRLFQQFFTTKPDGLGMGLSIVRSIVESHGGRIAAENVDGGGARFYFTLPVSKEMTK